MNEVQPRVNEGAVEVKYKEAEGARIEFAAELDHASLGLIQYIRKLVKDLQCDGDWEQEEAIERHLSLRNNRLFRMTLF